MATYVMFGKYSAGGLKDISADRTKKSLDLLKKLGGEVKSMYALLGEKDLLFVIDFPGMEAALKASVALSKLTGIAFVTSEAIPVEKFDKIMGEV
jgi:uncharacterized protein with GYD domain